MAIVLAIVFPPVVVVSSPPPWRTPVADEEVDKPQRQHQYGPETIHHVSSPSVRPVPTHPAVGGWEDTSRAGVGVAARVAVRHRPANLIRSTGGAWDGGAARLTDRRAAHPARHGAGELLPLPLHLDDGL